MANDKRAEPDLLEVTSSEGTIVMDCNIGMAMISLPPEQELPRKHAKSDVRGRSKSRRPRN